jgi:hypothetical protein
MWKRKLGLLILAGVPAFTGYPFTVADIHILPGITWGWAGYAILVNVLVAACAGRRVYANIVAVAALVALPVVFTGAALSFCLAVIDRGPATGPFDYSPHYVALCITMLTVVPLGLGMVSVVPMGALEQQLLQDRRGVGRMEKCALMFFRVFNHIVFTVIPNIIEVIREERRYGRSAGSNPSFGKLVRELVQIGVEGICAAVQFIPLWAVEIARLPGKKDPHHAKTSPSEPGT